MTASRAASVLATLVLLLALTLLAAAAGVFVRDVGASFRAGGTGPIEAGDVVTSRLYGYELRYELAVFSDVRVKVTVEALFNDWEEVYESNGSLLAEFRLPRPGVFQVVIENLEDRRGQLGFSVLQSNTVPPDLEHSLLRPLVTVAGVSLLASGGLYLATRRLGSRVPEAN